MRAAPGLILLAVFAAACSPQQGSDARDALNDAFASAQASLAATGAAGIVLPAGLGDPAPPRQPRRPGAAIPAHAAAMVGQAARSIRDAFGDPDLIRRDGPAEVWLYSGGTCHLDVMVYPDARGEPRVAFAAARATGLTRTLETACLREIAGGPPAHVAGPRLARLAGDDS